MCGLDFGLVQGAHIYPASAPASPDEPWNGLSLCANHHTAFDRHMVWVHPDTRAVVLHPRVLEQEHVAALSFIDGTADVLAEPDYDSSRPKSEMFERRYEFYGDRYAWAG